MQAIPTKARPEREAETERPKLWHVVLLDDDDHTYEYVIRLGCDLFGLQTERAYQVAKTVDEQGRAVLITTHLEHAELKVEQVHGFGRDQLIAGCSGAMSVILEPADYAGDESEN